MPYDEWTPRDCPVHVGVPNLHHLRELAPIILHVTVSFEALMDIIHLHGGPKERRR